MLLSLHNMLYVCQSSPAGSAPCLFWAGAMQDDLDGVRLVGTWIFPAGLRLVAVVASRFHQGCFCGVCDVSCQWRVNSYGKATK